MAYIFLHNPKESDVSKIARTLAHKKTVQDDWSTGSRKTIPVGSLAIMFRTNTEPRRIIGYGVTIGPVKVNRPHWNEERGRTSNMVDIKFERLVDAETKHRSWF